MGVIDDVMSALSTHWDSTVCAAPQIVNGHRLDADANFGPGRAVLVFNPDSGRDWVDASRTLVDEWWKVRLICLTQDGEADRDDIVSEADRILGSGLVDGYDNWDPVEPVDRSDQQYYRSFLKGRLVSYNNDYGGG